MWPFGRRQDSEEDAHRLRVEAGSLRLAGRFDAAYGNYKRAYAVYERTGDVDAQCNVLCSLAETTVSRDEREKFVDKIQALCESMEDPKEKEKALRNLEDLKERLRDHPLR